VLRDADRSLANWLGRQLPAGVGLRFDAPDPQWTKRPPEPLFIDAFLHSVLRDERGHQSGWSDLRDADGRVVGRQGAAQYFRLGYLITAWAARPEPPGDAADRAMAEHEVLGFVLDACAQYGVLPDDCLEGSLAESGVKTVLECAQADSPAAPGALWAGLGIGPRAYLELVLVAPAKAPVLADIAPPAREIVLNADQPARADPGSAPASQPERPFGTLRRWDKQTINEPLGGQAGR
jgi:Pvc16 N-terminal domain